MPARLAPLLGDLASAARLVRGLPGYLRRPLDVDACRSIVRERLARRDDDFLAFADSAVFGHDASPYRALLQHAGCTRGDLAGLVRRDGLDGALHALFRAGVYLTVDEFKGRCAAVRGSASFTFDPRRLKNPLAVPHFAARTGGSRGPATRVQLDLASVRDRAVNVLATLAARGGTAWEHAIWGLRGIAPLLWHSGHGRPAARWFLLRDPATLAAGSRFLWSARIVTWTSRLAGVPLPAPESAPLDDPRPIVAWLASRLRAGAQPHLWGASSGIVHVCRAAQRAGLDLAGAHFTLTGEPVTAARLCAVRAAGGDPLPDYGSADSGGSLACGCTAPAAADDMHVFEDLNALIRVEDPPFPPGALLVTSLRRTAPFVFLNVSTGDRGVLEQRACGCPLERSGWRTHLREIRSYEKLTAGGITFEDGEVVRLLEDTLPRRFGGGPTDYQLIEESADDGIPRLRLAIAPDAGAIDAGEVARVFLDALGRSSENARDMAEFWRTNGVLRVVREAPRASAAAKILHLAAGEGGAAADDD